MILRRGDLTNLCGNAVVYWDIIGENVIAPGFNIFAINFTVSSLPIDNKLLTATFPPIPFNDFDELVKKLEDVQCDIIYGGELKFPKEQKALNKFYKNEFAKYNKVIEEYVDIYKEKFSFSFNRMTEQDKLKLLENLSEQVRTEIKNDEEIEAEADNKQVLTDRLLKLIEHLQVNSKYDISNFKEVIFLPGEIGDRLSHLYTKKFLAIYHEDYENANLLKNKISKLENTLDDEDINDNL